MQCRVGMKAAISMEFSECRGTDQLSCHVRPFVRFEISKGTRRETRFPTIYLSFFILYLLLSLATIERKEI